MNIGTILGHLERVKPDPIRWPRFPEINTRIRQVTTAAQPARIQNGLGSSNVATINQPKPVTILRVTTAVLNSTTKKLTVAFLQNSDPNYQKVNIHLKVGNALPVLVGSSPTSPISVTVARTTAPGTILVQAEGNWGPHPLGNSPSKPVYLV